MAILYLIGQSSGSPALPDNDFNNKQYFAEKWNKIKKTIFKLSLSSLEKKTDDTG